MPASVRAMRAPPPRLIAVLALAGTIVAAVLGGCGKGGASQGAGGVPTGGGGGGGPAPAAQGVVGVSTKNTTRLGGAAPADDAAAVAQAVFAGFTPATRPQAVVLVDEHDWPSALAASALASAPLGAPILYASGDSLPDATVRALHAMRPIGATALGGAQVVRIGTSAPLPDGLRARSIAKGSEPAATAAGIEELLATVRGGSARQVIVVASDAPPALQMPAAALSAESGAPILLVRRTGVPAATSAALQALHRPAIYVVAPRTLGKAAYAALARLGTVTHVTGAAGAGEATSADESDDAVENAISVSRFSHGSFGWGIHEAGHGLVFANVSRPLDAPAAAPLAAHGDYGPLLLLAHSASVPGALTRYLSNIEPGYTAAVPPVREVYNHGWLIGDERAISALAQAELDTVLEIAPRQPSAAEASVAAAE
jgi:ell wall binding domain 2 (CWB2)